MAENPAQNPASDAGSKGEELLLRPSCGLCGSSGGVIVADTDRKGRPLTVAICQECGLVRVNPIPSDEELEVYYREEYRLHYKSEYQPGPKQLVRTGLKAMERLERLRPWIQAGNRSFDLGAGCGVLAHYLSRLGMNSGGLEPNEGYARYAANVLKAKVDTGIYQDFELKGDDVDLLTLFHVLEHLPDPSGFFRRARKWVREGGILAIEVPNVEAVCQWPKNMFHSAHLHYFNLATLQETGAVQGWTPVKSETSPDGGNIFVAFKKSDLPDPNSSKVSLPGNAERETEILKRHTPARHLFSRYPYLRPLKKLRERRVEFRLAKLADRDPVQLLDHFLERWQ